MRLNLKALAIASAIGWAAGVCFVGVANRIWPSYGVDFLNLMSSIYPGFHPGGLREVIVATLYAALDGAVCGAVVAWLYNRALGPATPHP